MKHIEKRQPPKELARYVERENPQRWENIHQSRYYPHLYEDCLTMLRNEQSGLSGYTEKPLRLQGQGVHVDHFRKQALFPSQSDIFGWNNLIADEHHVDYGADHKDSLVNSKEDYAKLIDPVVQDPHHFFTYMENGRIIPKQELGDEEKEMADFTIATFNLQHPSLLGKREEIIRTVRSYKQGGMSEEDILACVESYGFPSAIEYALK